VSKVIQVSGIIAAGETGAALAYVKGRRGLSPRLMKLFLFGCLLIVGFPMAAWISGSWFMALAAVEAAGIGLVVAMLSLQLMAGPAMRRALARRGQDDKQALTFRLTAEALVYELSDLTMTARWSCVTDLYSTRKYWVFLVQSSVMVLPRRFFASPQAEREFIDEALSRMPDAARTRSPDAVRIVCG
jgi:hypothetical protein